MCVHVEPWGMPKLQKSDRIKAGSRRTQVSLPHSCGKFTLQVESLLMARSLWFYTADPQNPAGATSRLHLRPLVILGGGLVVAAVDTCKQVTSDGTYSEKWQSVKMSLAYFFILLAMLDK